MNTEDFTAKVVGIVIAIIIVAVVAIPIIHGMVGKDGYAADGTTVQAGKTYPIQEGSTLATIIEVIPIFLVLAILMTVVYMFLNKNRE